MIREPVRGRSPVHRYRLAVRDVVRLVSYCDALFFKHSCAHSRIWVCVCRYMCVCVRLIESERSLTMTYRWSLSPWLHFSAVRWNVNAIDHLDRFTFPRRSLFNFLFLLQRLLFLSPVPFLSLSHTHTHTNFLLVVAYLFQLTLKPSSLATCLAWKRMEFYLLEGQVVCCCCCCNHVGPSALTHTESS